MHATLDPPVVALSANERFKLGYPRTVRRATLVAIVLMLILAGISPQYVPQPYVLRTHEFTIIDLELPPDLIEPEVAAAPVMPRELEPVEDDAVVEPYDFPDPDDFWNPPAPGPAPAMDAPFVASSSNPVVRYFAKPEYPEIARLARLEGTVIVHVLVGPDGNVIEAVVVQRVHPTLDRAALTAARRCRFTPGRQREMPVKAWLAVPYRFSLQH